MKCQIEVRFTPAEISTLQARDLSATTCVVFDVLRATSVFVTALANGAEAIYPVVEIHEAIALRGKLPRALLAGEREGRRIVAAQSGGIEFDLGNSPTEYTRERVAGRTIISTTTNGTRALRSCQRAERVLIGSFLNMAATSKSLRHERNQRILVVCAGTGDAMALEDVLAAGALCAELSRTVSDFELSDSALAALPLFRNSESHLSEAVRSSRNARRLLSELDLRDDVEFCLRRDSFPLVAALEKDGAVRLAT